jgi:MFS family permease
MTSSSQSTNPSSSIPSRLDRLPWRSFHTRITLALGIGWLLDSFEVNVIGNVLGILKTLWRVSDLQASALVTVWLVGIMIGALLFGYFTDRFGRRKLFLFTLLLYSTCTVISALSPGYYFFLVFRFLTAIGVGAEYSAINAAIGEFIPAKFRGRANAVVMNFWPFGAIIAALLSLFFINLLPPSLGWRLAFGLGAIIALFTIWVRSILPESPRWLLRRGRLNEASRVMEQIEAGAYHFGPSLAEAKQGLNPPGFGRQLIILCREHPARLALASLLDFTEAAGYYGIFAFLPLIVLPRVHIAEQNVPWFFLIGNIGAAAGGALAAALLDKAGRKFTVTSFYLLAAVSMIGMGGATLAGDAGGVLAAFIVVNFCATGSWVSAYPTFSEIFPTALRSTGIGFAVAFGRIGAGFAPLLLVALAQQTSVMIAFGMLALCYALGALVMLPWILFGPEARGQSLEMLSPEAA